MCERLHQASDEIRGSDCVARDLRDEAAAFLGWLEHGHMTMLGYEYLRVEHSGSAPIIVVDESASLGLLRHRNSRGVEDLRADLNIVVDLDDADLRNLRMAVRARNNTLRRGACGRVA